MERLRGDIGIQPMTEPLLPYKFIVHVAKAKAGLPIRGGLARAAGWTYLFKNYVLKDWVTFAEVYRATTASWQIRRGRDRAG